jgi:4,5-dihydroxyphthalate decarboxylase
VEHELSQPLVLRTALGKHAHVAPLRDGRVTSSMVKLEFFDYEPLPKAFREMVRTDNLDVAELAVVTHLMAHHFGRKLTGLAIPLWSRLPHANLVCPVDSPISGPADLAGKRLGVRAYGQTSGVWVRGVLETEYGLDLDSITWLTMEDSHLAEYVDPSNCQRNTTSKGLRELMMEGELAAIMGERIVDPNGVRTVVADPEGTADRWIAKTGMFPINHGLVVQTAPAEQHPWLLQELYDMFDEARRIAVEEDGAEPPPPYGFEANRRSIQLLLDYSARQQITPRRYEASDLFCAI